jgi:hypothetical protein
MKPAWSTKSKSFARHPLGDALEGVLSGLVALEARVNLNPLLATLSGARAQGEAQTTRLREVLDRDRALVAATAPLRAAVEARDSAREQNEQARDFAREQNEQARTAVKVAAREEEVARVSAVPEQSAAASSSNASAACEEPIRTRTMARLLAAQGHKQRALSIYDVLLASDDDPGLRTEAEQLRAQQA